MRHLDLFSGIGGFALATEMVWDKVEHIFCDNEPFAQQILKKHWPQAQIYGDIRALTYAEYNGRNGAENAQGGVAGTNNNAQGAHEVRKSKGSDTVRPVFDLLTGGFPCQPFSQAGRRKGTGDDRFLWPEMLRVIREFRPRWVVGENVAGLLSIEQGVVFEQVCADLEGEGYAVQAFVIPAVAINAPHRRDRVWIVAHAESNGGGRNAGEVRQENGRQDDEHDIGAFDADKDASDTGREHGQPRRSEGLEHSAPKRTPQATETERHCEARGFNAPDTSNKGLEGRHKTIRQKKGRDSNTGHRTKSYGWDANWLEVATRLCTLDDGLPNGLARPRGWRNAALKGAGNAIVPQVAAEIMRGIKEIDEA